MNAEQGIARLLMKGIDEAVDSLSKGPALEVLEALQDEIGARIERLRDEIDRS
jgi:hypothetical protein